MTKGTLCCVLVILVASVLLFAVDVLMPRLYFTGALSPSGYGILKIGSLLFLIPAAAWVTARFCRLSLRAAAVVGTTVFVVGQVLPFGALILLLPDRPSSTVSVGAFVSVCMIGTLLSLMLACLGAWIGERMRSRQRRPAG